MIKRIFSLNANVKKILLIQWFTSIGYFTIIPYFAFYLIEHLHFSIAFVGVQMTLLLAGQYSTTLLGGVLSDRIAPAKIMAFGLLAQISCYFLLALGPQLGWQISALTLMIGIGKSLYTPAAKKLVLIHAQDVDRVFLFSLRSTVNNIGVALGSLIGALSIKALPAFFFISAGAIQILAFAFLAKYISVTVAPATPDEKVISESIWHHFKNLISIKNFLMLALLYCGFNILYIQLEFTFPLEAAHQFSAIGISTIFLTNSIVVIFLQMPINVTLARYFAPIQMLTMGFALMAAAFFLIMQHAGMPVFAFAVALFTIGEIIVDPNVDALVSASVPSHINGSAFGILGVFALLGGTLGNSAGALLFEHSPSSLWAIGAVLGTILAIASLILSFQADEVPNVQ